MLISASRAECTYHIQHRSERERTWVSRSGEKTFVQMKWTTINWTRQRVGSLSTKECYCLFSLDGGGSGGGGSGTGLVRYAGRRITKSILWCILFVSLCDHVLQHFGRCSVDIFASSYFRFVLFQFKYVYIFLYISIYVYVILRELKTTPGSIAHWTWNARLPTHIASIT